jgi:putative transposase
MIDRDHARPITRQATLLGMSRGTVYYLPRPTSAGDLELMRRIDELHLEYPFRWLHSDEGQVLLRDHGADYFSRRHGVQLQGAFAVLLHVPAVVVRDLQDTLFH